MRVFHRLSRSRIQGYFHSLHHSICVPGPSNIHTGLFYYYYYYFKSRVLFSNLGDQFSARVKGELNIYGEILEFWVVVVVFSLPQQRHGLCTTKLLGLFHQSPENLPPRLRPCTHTNQSF